MGLSGLDFMTVAGNFLDAFTRARREDMAFRRNAAREDQQISAQRQYESGVREGEHAFQSAMADQARAASRQQSDTEWQRGAEQRAMQQALLQQQLGMSTAQFEEWKATAAGRAEMAKLEGDKTRAEINRLNAEAGHYARMGGGGSGGGQTNGADRDWNGDGRVDQFEYKNDRDTWQYFTDMGKKVGLPGAVMEQVMSSVDDQAKATLSHKDENGAYIPVNRQDIMRQVLQAYGGMDPSVVQGPRPGAAPFRPVANPYVNPDSPQFDPAKAASILQQVQDDANADADSAYATTGRVMGGRNGLLYINSANKGKLRKSFMEKRSRAAGTFQEPDPDFPGNMSADQRRKLAYNYK